MVKDQLKSVKRFLLKIPAIIEVVYGLHSDGHWWFKFPIDIEHPLAWNVVQEFGHILNYISIEEKLPTDFYPVSPPPFLNGGPKEFLFWIIENRDETFTPNDLKKWLEGRLPDPVYDEKKWYFEEEE